MWDDVMISPFSILIGIGWVAVFDEKRVTIYDKSTRQIVMQGHRDPNTTLYMINMAAPLR